VQDNVIHNRTFYESVRLIEKKLIRNDRQTAGVANQLISEVSSAMAYYPFDVWIGDSYGLWI